MSDYQPSIIQEQQPCRSQPTPKPSQLLVDTDYNIPVPPAPPSTPIGFAELLTTLLQGDGESGSQTGLQPGSDLPISQEQGPAMTLAGGTNTIEALGVYEYENQNQPLEGFASIFPSPGSGGSYVDMEQSADNGLECFAYDWTLPPPNDSAPDPLFTANGGNNDHWKNDANPCSEGPNTAYDSGSDWIFTGTGYEELDMLEPLCNGIDLNTLQSVENLNRQQCNQNSSLPLTGANPGREYAASSSPDNRITSSTNQYGTAGTTSTDKYRTAMSQTVAAQDTDYGMASEVLKVVSGLLKHDTDRNDGRPGNGYRVQKLGFTRCTDGAQKFEVYLG
ncbi:hypothetical protein MFIFM68171_06224 [Madurella fahalii]|uniref:Uncharacterized protein n=1 Tax=Madurella fahalii TaxID=1157608 RepID=A0ABQ0GE21_9PEZI